MSKPLALIIFMSLIFWGCMEAVGNPNLSGPWTCQETSQIFLKASRGTIVYQVTFESDAINADRYYIDNFYKLGSGVRVAVIKDGYSISLLRQSVDGFIFEGAGSINETFDLINLSYTDDDGGGVIDHVTAEYSR